METGEKLKVAWFQLVALREALAEAEVEHEQIQAQYEEQLKIDVAVESIFIASGLAEAEPPSQPFTLLSDLLLKGNDNHE